jgi:hypothetical protein
VQGYASHPGKQGGGQEKNNWKNGGLRRRRGPREVLTLVKIFGPLVSTDP